MKWPTAVSQTRRMLSSSLQLREKERRSCGGAWHGICNRQVAARVEPEPPPGEDDAEAFATRHYHDAGHLRGRPPGAGLCALLRAPLGRRARAPAGTPRGPGRTAAAAPGPPR